MLLFFINIILDLYSNVQVFFVAMYWLSVYNVLVNYTQCTCWQCTTCSNVHMHIMYTTYLRIVQRLAGNSASWSTWIYLKIIHISWNIHSNNTYIIIWLEHHRSSGHRTRRLSSRKGRSHLKWEEEWTPQHLIVYTIKNDYKLPGPETFPR